MAQMAMGAMQIAMGLLGLLAGAAAGNKGAQNQSNASGLSTISSGDSGGGTSPTGSSENPSGGGIANGGTSSSGVGIDNIALRKGTLGAAMDGIEKNYGIPRDKFVEALKAGVDPKDLLANAPKNAPSMDLLNKISAGLAATTNAATKEAADRALASLGGAGTSMGAPEGSAEAARGTKPPSATHAGDEIDTNPNAGGAETVGLSPEVKAAMAERAAKLMAEKEAQEMTGWNIFQLVHNRYQKLETMLYGRVEHTNLRTTP